MNKATRDQMRLSLRNIKKYPYFVYFPLKKGLGGDKDAGKSGLFGDDITLVFMKTRAEADKTIKELKPKRGNLYASGIVEKDEEGGLLFQCVKEAPERLGRDIKLLTKEVPELKDAKLTTIAESEEQDKRSSVDEKVTKQVATDIQDSGVNARHEVGKIKNVDVRKQATDALNRLDEYTNLVHEAQTTYATYDKQGPALKTYLGKFTDEVVQRIAGQKLKETEAGVALEEATRKKVAEDVKKAKTAQAAAQEEIAHLTGLKKQMEEQWGALMAIRTGARDHVGEVVTAFDAAVKLRDKVDGPKTLAKLVAHLDVIKPKLGGVQGEVYRFGEKMVEMQRRIHDHALTDPIDLIEMPTDPSKIVEVDTAPRVTPIDRLYATALLLLKSTHLDDLLEKQALIPTIKTLTAPTNVGVEPSAVAAFRDDLTRLALASKLTAAKLESAMAKVNSAATADTFMKALTKAGVYPTLDLSNFVQGAQEWVVEVESKFESIAKFNEKVVAAGRAAVTATTLVKYVKFPADLVGGSVVTRSSDTGGREIVKLQASGRIIVCGGGPIGLMSAVEASKQGGRVTVFEGRPNEYSRQNVLKLTEETVNRLERYGVYRILGLTGDNRTRVKVADLEDALLSAVKGMGIRVVKGKGVSELSRDPHTGEMLCLVDGVHEAADLVVVAVGSGVKNANKYAGDVVMSEQLGISVKEFGLIDHVISANLDKDAPVDHEQRDKTDEDKKVWQVILETPSQKYVLAQLTPKEYAEAQGSKEKLKAIIRERAKVNPDFAKMDISDVGRFEVIIQRSDKFRGKDLGAVVVGDSAATPHPESGSGTNVGALEVDVVSDLVRGLVDSANERFGKRREKVEKSLDEYDERMQDIVGKQTRKGMANMISVRQRRASLSRKILSDWRKGLNDGVALDPEATRIITEMSMKIPALSPPSTDALFNDWEAAKKRGTLVEELNAALEELLEDAKKQQALDPNGREALMLTKLQKMVYVA